MSKKLIPLIFAATSAFAQESLPLDFLKTNPASAQANACANADADAGSCCCCCGGGGGKQDLVLRVVDSMGDVVGRFEGPQTLFINYNNKLMAVPLGADVNGSGQATSGGFNWLDSNVWYTTANCTGTKYFQSFSYGTRFIGYSVLQNGQYDIFIIDSAQGANVTYNSVQTSGVCSANSGSYWLTPAQTSIPAAPLGAPPFFLKLVPK